MLRNTDPDVHMLTSSTAAADVGEESVPTVYISTLIQFKWVSGSREHTAVPEFCDISHHDGWQMARSHHRSHFKPLDNGSLCA